MDMRQIKVKIGKKLETQPAKKPTIALLQKYNKTDEKQINPPKISINLHQWRQNPRITSIFTELFHCFVVRFTAFWLTTTRAAMATTCAISFYYYSWTYIISFCGSPHTLYTYFRSVKRIRVVTIVEYVYGYLSILIITI